MGIHYSDQQMEDVITFVKYVFGVDQLLPAQEDIINAFLTGHLHIFFSAPTGKMYKAIFGVWLLRIGLCSSKS